MLYIWSIKLKIACFDDCLIRVILTMDKEQKQIEAVRSRVFMAFRLSVMLLLVLVGLVITLNEGNNPYLRIGWHNELNILGIPINTPLSYTILVIFLGLFDMCEVFVNDTIFPYVNNNVRDNNVKHIKEFTRTEIRIITNGTFFISSIKWTLTTVIMISQIDIALIKVICGEIACLYTTGIQLDEKESFMDNDKKPIVNAYEVVVCNEEDDGISMV